MESKGTLKAGVHMKMSGKSDFLFSLELASSTIGLHIGKSCFGVFLKFKCELAAYIQEVYEMWLVAMAIWTCQCDVKFQFFSKSYVYTTKHSISSRMT